MSQSRSEEVKSEPTPDRPQYSADELERVVRRAAELQSLSGDGDRPAFSEDELKRIAADVGIATEHVEEALAELRARDLLDEELDDHPLLAWLFGSPVASANRRVAGRKDAVQAAIETQLEDEQGLQPLRRAPGLSVWEPSGGLTDMVERLTDFSGRRFKLVEAEAVSLNLTGWDRDHVLVRLSADLSEKRKEWINNWAGGIAVALVVIWAVFDSSAWIWLLLAALGIAGVVVAILDIRRNMRAQCRRIRLALDGILDRISP